MAMLWDSKAWAQALIQALVPDKKKDKSGVEIDPDS